ncbi:MAG: metalloregulator ArsR/SmtB family transcription factor [Gammaproteobacteria bacterium]|nr:metalloregulator ArsR/SmtB family transcription factor [Gammaproteobacteria bacterium]MDH4315912.1 metalloregulator ArsR/SmtB family transcription factor [Gammaproteobacteria bacterium]MDH5214132.1 metalloregulator ArsR/SmtB family transcription factor [Gammaproteobacteria bacterium]MDH5500194.1 metalloregulator ArsR/SmtB family transcription factor [Gammaproteobacteria bacterium]
MEKATEDLLLQLRTLGDAVRMRLVALCGQGECSVSELAKIAGLSQPRTSQHLKQLCDAGLLTRFRDGKRVYYSLPQRQGGSARQLLALIPQDDESFRRDRLRLRQMRGALVSGDEAELPEEVVDRAIHRAILELTVTAPIGDLLDVGCGRGSMLKLLAGRAHRVVGVDIDADTRQLARAELMLAGLPNCVLRQGDMYQLPFSDAEFDTIILDDVLGSAARPVAVLREAARLLRANGRLFILMALAADPGDELRRKIAGWGASAGLRLSPARVVPRRNPQWLLSVATLSQSRDAAA